MSTAAPEREAPAFLVSGRAWVWPVACLALALLVLAIALRDTWLGMVNVWLNSETFGHAFLVAPIAGWLVWHQRRRLQGLTPRPWLPGLAAVAALIGLWYVADAVGVALGQQIAGVGLISALTLTLLGWRIAWVLAFPLGYLIFMVPFGEALVPPLQTFTADFALWWLRQIGVPVFRDGIMLHLPTGSFEVAEACAGLRYLIAMIVLGVLFAGITYRQWWRRAAFMGLAVIVPIIANGFRALGIILLAYWSDHRIAVGVDHVLYGWVFLTAVMLVLLWLGLLLREKPQEDPPRQDGSRVTQPPAQDAAPAVPLATATLVSIALIFAAPAYADWRIGQQGAAGALVLQLPDEVGHFTRTGQPVDDWRANFTGADAEAFGTYQRADGQVVDLYEAVYLRQRQGAEVINATNSLVPAAQGEPGTVSAVPRWTRIGDYPVALTVDGRTMDVAAVRLRSFSGQYRLAVPLYWVDDILVHRPAMAKLRQLLALFSGHSAAAAIVAAAPYSDDPTIAAEALSDFLANWPELRGGIAAAAGTD